MKKRNRAIRMLLLCAVCIFCITGCAQTEAQHEEQREERTPQRAIYELLGAEGTMTLTLHLTEGGACGSYTVAVRQFMERLEVLLDCYDWTETEALDGACGEYWLTAVSSDGVRQMTFFPVDAGLIRYDDSATTIFWAARSQYGGSVSIAELVRQEYNGLDFDTSRISFPLDGSAEEAAEMFAYHAYGSHLKDSLAPGNGGRVIEYAVVDWGIQEVSEDDSAVVGRVSYAFVPEDENSPDIWAGNTGYGTGEYEGMLTAYREFVLQKQEDGCWHCIGCGTGGYRLPE